MASTFFGSGLRPIFVCKCPKKGTTSQFSLNLSAFRCRSFSTTIKESEHTVFELFICFTKHQISSAIFKTPGKSCWISQRHCSKMSFAFDRPICQDIIDEYTKGCKQQLLLSLVGITMQLPLSIRPSITVSSSQ